jgi:hypothetical protein
MRPTHLAILILSFTLPAWTVSAQPKISWQKCLGGSGQDAANCVIQTAEGGYVVAGLAESYDGDVTGYTGSNSAWVVKLSAEGKIIWEECLSGYEVNSIIETQDGGLVVAGPAGYQDSTLTGYHGDGDAWVARLSNSGSLIWQRIYGGTGDDDAVQILQTADGGFAFVGSTTSTDDDLSKCPGTGFGWLVKLSDSGEIQWQRRFARTWENLSGSLAESKSGEFVVVGECGDTAQNSSVDDSYLDGYVAKFDDTGAIIWQELIRSGADLTPSAVLVLPDSTILLAGECFFGFYMTDTTHTIPLGGTGWLVKLNDTGGTEWQKYIFETGNDAFYSIVPTPDSDFIVAGNNGNSERDAWVVRMDDTGGIVWQESFGGSREDYAQSIVPTLDGGLIFAGGTNSDDSEVSGWHGDSSSVYDDMWVVKLGGTDVAQVSVSSADPLLVRCYPNPASSEAVLSFNLPQSAEVSISILDALGREMQVIPALEMDAGAHEIALDASHIPTGIYECRINYGGASAVSKLVVVH